MCRRRSSSSLSPEEERILIKDIALAAESKSKEGDTFFLITQRYSPQFSRKFSLLVGLFQISI